MNEAEIKSETERLAAWMIQMSFATGHGYDFEGLLKELEWQIQELRDKVWKLEKP